ncbi:biotin-dependent carboxyltransferase family protein [Myxococcus fulvus]|uniref:5-oxoprolinase subunit C family protein n=1 Tax=Myxococcus fulvus TaxID=33 RepID=UPI0020C0CEB3|nr:biotin-dependent carboxyltransferase family protein [Myxococcus fulvus]MCK8502432.1 biotin-dependent carboxyltransferase family protein [Myxococcus fulvus]
MAGWLDITAMRAPATVQDGGRPGQMHHGVPPGGAMVPELLARANRAVGNRWDAAALECLGALELRARGAPLRVSVDGHEPHALDEGEVLRVPTPERASVSYVAVAGGVDVPVVLGGRGTLLVARLGGHEGRMLRPGDSLPVADALSLAMPVEGPWEAAGPIRLTLGPDTRHFDSLMAASLLGGTFTVSSASDRVGMRLQGPALAHGDEGARTSRPMVRGAIQVTLSGEPIILGPDHPTTGGYPVIATVIRADWGRLGARRAGTSVEFQAVSPHEAREAWREHARRFHAES